MSYQLRVQVSVDYLANGAQALGSVPAQQTLQLGQVALQGLGLATSGTSIANTPVPGGDTPNQSNFNSAVSTMATAIQNAIAANLGQIQGFATGGG